MKRILAFLFSLLPLVTWGANPSFDSFRQTNSGFIVNQPYIYVANTNTGGTNLIINGNVTYTNTTLNFFNTTNNYDGATIIITNSTVTFTNSTVTINGTNVATINPTIGRVPFKFSEFQFGDSALYYIDTNSVGVDTLADNTLIVTNISGGGVLYGKTFGGTSGYVTNLVLATGVLQSDGSTLFFGPAGSSFWTNNSPVAPNSLQPIDLTQQPLVQNGWFVGTNSPATFGGSLNDGTSFFSFQRTDLGDPDYWDMTVGAGTGYPSNGAFFEVTGFNNRADLTVRGTGDYQVGMTAEGTEPDAVIQIIAGGTTKTALHPTEADGTSPYKLDTTIIHTAGNLLEVANDTTNAYVWTVNGPNPRFKVTDISGNVADFGIETPGYAFVRADAGKVVAISVTGGNDVWFTGSAIYPASGTVDVGSNGHHFRDVGLTRYLYIDNSHTPSSSSELGAVGQVTWDSSFLYVWTATNVNKRVSLSTW